MRRLFTILLLCASAFCHANTVFPTRSVKFITNLPVGSGPDLYVRKLADLLQTRWNQKIFIENRPGAGGLVALEYFVTQAPDAHNIFWGDFGVLVVMPILHNKEHLFNNLRPLTTGYNGTWVVIVAPHIKSWQQLKESLGSNVRFGSWGVASGGHLCASEVAASLGVPAVHVPYKEYGQWFADTSNGTLNFGCASQASSDGFVRSGRLNIVATTSTQRETSIPDVPTMQELTGRRFETGEAFLAFYSYAKLSSLVLAKLEQDLANTIAGNEMQIFIVDQLRALPMVMNSRELARHRQRKIDEHRAILRRYDISILDN